MRCQIAVKWIVDDLNARAQAGAVVVYIFEESQPLWPLPRRGRKLAALVVSY